MESNLVQREVQSGGKFDGNEIQLSNVLLLVCFVYLLKKVFSWLQKWKREMQQGCLSNIYNYWQFLYVIPRMNKWNRWEKS